MKEKLALELEEIILNHLTDGFTFKDSEVEAEWLEKHPDIPFKTVYSILFAKNKVGLVWKGVSEYRSIDRTD